MKGLMVTIAVVCAVISSVPQAEGKTFYLKNGEEIEYQQSWRKDGIIYLLINRDTLLEFYPKDVDLKRSRVAAQARIPSRKPAKAGDDAGRSNPDSSGEGGKDAAKSSVAAAPASAAGGRVRNPGKATVAASKGYKPATPAVQAELAGLYSKFYAAVRAGDTSEQLRYVTGKQRRSVEKLHEASGEGKAFVLELLRTLPERYVVTGASIAADKKGATLTTVRKSPVDNYEMVGNEFKKTGSTRYRNITGVVHFVKEGNEWKIASVEES